MAIQEVLISTLQAYTPLLAFLAAAFIGDALIILGALAGAGKLSIWTIAIFGLLGELFHDILFYFISNSKFANYIKKKLKLSKKRSKIAGFIEKLGKNSYFLPLFIAKFIYGVRDAMVLYVSHNEKKFKRYLWLILRIDILWLAIILMVGWLAGKGFTELLYVLKGIEKGLLILVLTIILIYIINKFIVTTLLRQIKKHGPSIINKLWNSNN